MPSRPASLPGPPVAMPAVPLLIVSLLLHLALVAPMVTLLLPGYFSLEGSNAG